MKMGEEERALKEALLAELARVAAAEAGLIPWHHLIGRAVSLGICRIVGDVGVTGPQVIKVELSLLVERGSSKSAGAPAGSPFGEGAARQ